MVPAEPAARRLRAATRTNALILVVVVLAVALPRVVHFTGFRPAGEVGGLGYPGLFGYPFRVTPGQEPNHGIDFSQVWLSARRMSAGEPVYYPVKKKTWRRKWSSTYHGFIHWLYIPLGKLDFRTALVIHNLAGVGLLLLVSALALRREGCSAAIPTVLAVILALMYLSPVGLLHLERGQMDVFVAASIVCVFGLFVRGERAWGVAAGLLSTLKVQAWVFAGLYWCVAAPLRGLRDRSVWWLPGTIVALNVIFLRSVIEWLPSFLYVANDSSRYGASFTLFLPRQLAAVLPFVSAVAVSAAACGALARNGLLRDETARRELLQRVSFPLAATLAIQTTCATPVTHDYRLVALLGLVPLLALWCAAGERIPGWLRAAVCVLFASMLLTAMRVRPMSMLPFEVMARALAGFSMLFLAASLTLAWVPRPLARPADVRETAAS